MVKSKRHAWLVRALMDQGHTQRDLAKEWGIDDAVVTRFIATGKPDLTIERQQVLSRMLGLDHNELILRLTEGLAPRVKRPSAISKGAPPPPRDNGRILPPQAAPGSELERLMNELREAAERLRHYLPGMDIDVTFSCRGKE